MEIFQTRLEFYSSNMFSLKLKFVHELHIITLYVKGLFLQMLQTHESR